MEHSSNSSSKSDSMLWHERIFALTQRNDVVTNQGCDLFIGSSSISMWSTLMTDFSNLRVVNNGIGGAVISDIVRFADEIIFQYNPGSVTIYAGENDIADGSRPDDVARGVIDLCKSIRNNMKDVVIVIMSIKPSPSRWDWYGSMINANRLLSSYCSGDEKLYYADVANRMLGNDGLPIPELFQTDGVHLSMQGYGVWVAVLRLVWNRINRKHAMLNHDSLP